MEVDEYIPNCQVKSGINRLLSVVILCLTGYFSFAQTGKTYTYSAEFGGVYSVNNQIPFWIRNNQYGVLPDSGRTVLFIQNLHTKEDTSQRFFKLSAGLELATNVGKEVRIALPEAFTSFKMGKAQLLLGRKKQIFGFTDTTLSSGSFSWSGNALPIPEIQVSVPDYINLFKGALGIKGHYAHGWFGNQSQAQDYYLHSKSLYGRIGKPNAKIKFYGGIVHHAQWGGKPKYEVDADNWLTIDGKFASGWNTYKNIVFPFNNPPRDSSNVAIFDFENRYGNHLGQIDLGGELNTKTAKWLFYKQLPFETGQTFSSLGNLDDGLYGISISSKKSDLWFKKVVFEFLHTTNQGMYRSGFLKLIGFEGRHYGRDQNYYFSHAQYRDGWSYNGRTIGTPFLIPAAEIRSEKLDSYDHVFRNNNNIKAGYIGLSYNISGVKMESRVSFSKNYGTENNVFLESADQLSFGHKMSIPVNQLGGFINLSVGLEQGDLIQDNFGLMLSYKRIWQ